MSNPNKTEINKRYGEAVMSSLSTTTNNAFYNQRGLSYDENISTGTAVINNLYTNINDIEHICSNSVICRPQYLNVEMTKDCITAVNRNMKIKDVEIIIPNKVVRVTFDDDTIEKSICHEDDEFNLETAIMVCIAKHLLGGAKFNNLISKALKLYNNKIKAEEKAKEEEARIEAKRKKNHERLMKYIAKKEKEAREARINELAEAIVRAGEIKNNIPYAIEQSCTNADNEK